MTAAQVTRDEFEDVKQLLASAARYAESANEKIDRLADKVDRVTEKVDTLATAQQRTQQQLDSLAGNVQQLSGKVDEFVFQAQRLLTQQADRLAIVEVQSESLDAVARRLDCSFEEQRSQFAEYQRTTTAALDRIDRVLDYLMRRDGGNNRGGE